MSNNRKLTSMGLVFEQGVLRILDQRYLPDEERWVTVGDPDHANELIQGLAVRGAPLIGVFAALTLGLFATKQNMLNPELIKQTATNLSNARPSAVNLIWAIDRMMRENPSCEANGLLTTAIEIFNEDVEMCRQMGEHGAKFIKDGDNILTICNTGGLATVGIGTALGVIRSAAEAGKKIHVYFCETRPLLQGGRLTAWELQKLGIPHTLICDSMAAGLMRDGKIQKCFVGADRIAANGDFANKIGTYNLAVLAKHHGIPFYTVAPTSTVDMQCQSGQYIPIEERSASEVRGVSGSFGDVRWAPRNCKTFNPAFDMTPSSLLSGIVLNSGVHNSYPLKI